MKKCKEIEYNGFTLIGFERSLEVGYNDNGDDVIEYNPVITLDNDLTSQGFEIPITVYGISSALLSNIIKVLRELESEIVDSLIDEKNNGIVFHACGFNGRAQSEMIEYYKRNYKVKVF